MSHFASSMLINHYMRCVEASATNTVCLDFDGVLAQWELGMPLNAIGEPIPEGLTLAYRLMGKGYHLVILTARPDFLHPKIAEWLSSKGIDAPVTSEKPPALLYIDDRGFRFTGNPKDSSDILDLLEKESG